MTTKFDWLLIGGLLLLVLPLRLWLLHNTEVPARDSITYVQYALEFEQKDWRAVIAANHQHPGYPLLVWLMSLPVRAFDGQTTPENLALSTQLVSTMAALLLIVPMYWLGRQFFERKVSFAATLLFQYLPVGAQNLSDGVAESVYLLLVVSGVLFAVKAVRERGLISCGLCGVFAALAYLTRPEGLLLLPVTALVALLMQLRAEWRCSWGRFAACGAVLGLAVAVVGAPYPIATGRLTNKPSWFRFMGIKNPFEKEARHRQPPAAGKGAGVLFAASFPRSDSKLVRLANSVKALVIEVVQGLHFLGIAPALLGLWWSRGRVRRDPGFWIIAGYAGLHVLLLVALAMSAGYVSDRHVMILVLLGCYFAGAGLCELPARILTWRRVAPDACAWRRAPLWSAALLVGLIAFCVPKAAQRLHGNRAANHAAGRWLAQRVDRADLIDDVYDWSRYYAGQFLKTRHDPDHAALCYIVIPTRGGPVLKDSYVYRPEAKKRPDAKVAYCWPENVDATHARLVIYVQPRECGAATE